ncbi:cytidine deaminase [Candidatus Nomurabacteria bacterium]|nr:cytidine deaminase [Candidatus Nomurabacteria bacterium]
MTNQEIINEALKVVHPIRIDDADMGGVGCALETMDGTVFKGVCIDTISGMGFCAEHTAVSQMITQGQYQIKKIVAAKKDDQGNITILPPCGRCREFIYQINNKNLKTEVVLGMEQTSTIKDLLPCAGDQYPIEVNL